METGDKSAGNGEMIASDPKPYDLCLYIAGASPRSLQAISILRTLCNTSLAGICVFKVVDILQQPQAAKDAQIIAVPTLIKKEPKPVRLFIGDMSNSAEILRGIKE
jgi:circadian clock protein KaiB